MLGGIKKAYYTMTTTNKNRNYYLDILSTPCYLMRDRLNKDYNKIIEYGVNTPEFFAMVAEHLTAYNELSTYSFFFRMRDFKPTI